MREILLVLEEWSAARPDHSGESSGDLSQDALSLLHVLSHFLQGWSWLAHMMMAGLQESKRKCVKLLEA